MRSLIKKYDNVIRKNDKVKIKHGQIFKHAIFEATRIIWLTNDKDYTVTLCNSMTLHRRNLKKVKPNLIKELRRVLGV